MAFADSQRLYSHIIIVNNCISEVNHDSASAKGTILCSPLHKKYFKHFDHSRDLLLGCADIGGQPPAITFFDVNLESLIQGIRNEKPITGYLPPPHCRWKKI